MVAMSPTKGDFQWAIIKNIQIKKYTAQNHYS